MTWTRELYPDSWEQIAHSVKQEAGWCCEECGRPCRKPGEKEGQILDRLSAYWKDDWMESVWDEDFGWVDVEKPTRFVLTVAHLDHRPENCARDNLKALCSVCHLKLDNTTSARFQKQQAKAERAGQLTLIS
ncbi:hypothetical protein D0962_18835 [Leptolyngbyaceae cyanobacterium CCMR0082]|uniref:HNH endonuclease n=1 Tax=Adonisia turfae CCMR0082 TaxID=2304604 RepID=A0A6M0S8M0_9CYAN|nr:hypothetical protein [Adonisia turfae]NEZ64817.1 hypothetical protein [Adonisia turfae CCMR0082]